MKNYIIEKNKKDGKGSIDLWVISVVEIIGLLMTLLGLVIDAGHVFGLGLFVLLFGGITASTIYDFIECKIMMKYFKSLE